MNERVLEWLRRGTRWEKGCLALETPKTALRHHREWAMCERVKYAWCVALAPAGRVILLITHITGACSPFEYKKSLYKKYVRSICEDASNHWAGCVFVRTTQMGSTICLDKINAASPRAVECRKWRWMSHRIDVYRSYSRPRLFVVLGQLVWRRRHRWGMAYLFWVLIFFGLVLPILWMDFCSGIYIQIQKILLKNIG